MTILDSRRFSILWQRLGGQAEAQTTFAALNTAYAAPHRAYHTSAHLADCLAQFDAAPALVNRPNEVEMALWFHDAIYDPHATDNEARSATWSIQALTKEQIPLTVAQNIASLVLITNHQSLPLENDAKLMVDIDLSILGRIPPSMIARFASNTSGFLKLNIADDGCRYWQAF